MNSTGQLITIFEHQTLRQSDFANSADFAWILEQIDMGKLPCFSIGYAGQVVVKVSHYLAVIRLPSGNVVEILPKISQSDIHQSNDNYLNPNPSNPNLSKSNPSNTNNQYQTRQWVSQMLSDIYGLKSQAMPTLSTAQPQANASQNPPLDTWLLPIIQAWYGLLMQMPNLLPCHYQQATQNNPQAQGKLLIKQQMSHNAHRPHYRYTQKQQLDLHPLWGQFFTTALQKVQGVLIGTTVPNEVVQAVQSISTVPAGLPPSQLPASYQQLKQMLMTSHAQRDSQSKQQLEMAVELAWLILQMQSVNSTPVLGNDIVPAVMINMHQAFERWVSVKLREQYQNPNQGNKQDRQGRQGKQGKVQTQARIAWITDGNENLPKTNQRYLQPDILIYDEAGNIEVVADVKYKHIERVSEISTADLYQLYTYYQHLQADQAWLIYPTDSKNKKILHKSQKLQLLPNLQNNDKKIKQIRVIAFDVNMGKLLLDV